MAILHEIIGKTVTKIDNFGDRLVFTCAGNARYALFHSQDCCESVEIDRIDGNLDILIGSPIIRAEERTYDEPLREYEDRTYQKQGQGNSS